jgi:hypothetical protein
MRPSSDVAEYFLPYVSYVSYVSYGRRNTPSAECNGPDTEALGLGFAGHYVSFSGALPDSRKTAFGPKPAQKVKS